MRVDSTLEAHAQLAEGGQPGMGALDHPAMAAQSVIAFDALACNSVLDSSQLEVCMAAREVIARLPPGRFAAMPHSQTYNEEAGEVPFVVPMWRSSYAK